jgi:hypothetical protein
MSGNFLEERKLPGAGGAGLGPWPGVARGEASKALPLPPVPDSVANRRQPPGYLRLNEGARA